MARRRLTLIAAGAATIAVLGGVVGAGTVAALDDTQAAVPEVTVTSTTASAADTTTSVSEVYRKVNKGVVTITVAAATSSEMPFAPPGSGSQQSQAQGSGFVYDEAGHIVTNQHVVDGAEEITVQFWDGSTASAELIGTDASTDLAVIQVDADASKLHPLALGRSSELSVGDGVIAVGSPFGLEGTVTSGIVSALHRQITAPNDFTIDDAIQTDAAINHGNSGGPLLDVDGNVVGVNSQIESSGGGSDGVGFAVPSDTIRPIVAQLISDGSVSHAYLGVGVATITSAAAAQLDVTPGVALTSVREGTPAAEAGLRAATDAAPYGGEEVPTGGDVITALDGREIETADELRRLIDAKQPGDELEVTYVRGGETHTVTVTLAERPS
jgi:S1-C subfamily serine protease